MLRLNTSCKSLFQVCANGQKACDTGNSNAFEVKIKVEVYRQYIDADRQCPGAAFDCRAMCRTR